MATFIRNHNIQEVRMEYKCKKLNGTIKWCHPDLVPDVKTSNPSHDGLELGNFNVPSNPSHFMILHFYDQRVKFSSSRNQ